MSIKPLSPARVDEVVALLGFDARPTPDVDGLHAVYRAWCRQIPFDNLRKLVALHFKMPELPGIDPADFFAAWQFTGAGATCWGSNNAIHALLVGLGFDAQLFAASMNHGEMNHGTTIVTIDGRRWLADTFIHGDLPLPLIDEKETAVEHAGFVTTARLDPGGWIIGCPTPDPEFVMPCRILDPMDYATTVEANEKTRGTGPFNNGIVVGINDETSVWILKEGVLARIEKRGTTTRTLSGPEVDEWLVDTAGHSAQLVAEVRAVLDFQAENTES